MFQIYAFLLGVSFCFHFLNTHLFALWRTKAKFSKFTVCTHIITIHMVLINDVHSWLIIRKIKECKLNKKLSLLFLIAGQAICILKYMHFFLIFFFLPFAKISFETFEMYTPELNKINCLLRNIPKLIYFCIHSTWV